MEANLSSEQYSQEALNTALTHIASIQNTFDKANTYVAFVFAEEPIMAGDEGYEYELYYSDINRVIGITNNPKRFILQRLIIIFSLLRAKANLAMSSSLITLLGMANRQIAIS